MYLELLCRVFIIFFYITNNDVLGDWRILQGTYPLQYLYLYTLQYYYLFFKYTCVGFLCLHSCVYLESLPFLLSSHCTNSIIFYINFFMLLVLLWLLAVWPIHLHNLICSTCLVPARSSQCISLQCVHFMWPRQRRNCKQRETTSTEFKHFPQNAKRHVSRTAVGLALCSCSAKWSL